MVTVAIVGAGVAGLTCGLALQTSGHRVIWLEKSRGVGGRLATRRLTPDSWVDHGVRYWSPQSAQLQALTQQLVEQGIVRPWSAQGFTWEQSLQPKKQTVYCAEHGLNAIAKHLAQGCDIRRQHRVTALTKLADGWQIVAESPEGPMSLVASAVVIAVPAPQVVPLLDPLDKPAVNSLNQVRYAPCLSLLTTYKTLPESSSLDHRVGWYVEAHEANHSVLSWLSLDSSKDSQPKLKAVLMQSQPDFAAQYLEQLDRLASDDLAAEALTKSTVSAMLAAAGAIVPGLEQPQTHRLHRWRYSVVNQAYSQPLLTTQWPSLVGCGDWCCPSNMTNLDAAYQSGLVAAAYLSAHNA
ncbi:MAG: FAD-dependent oxidoreductase [Cyanobacteria bacterium P01_H01_bin.21]